MIYLQPAVAHLRETVVAHNSIGSVEGLLAQHFLAKDALAQLDWHTHCTEEWLQREYNPGNIDRVAALGLTLHARLQLPWHQAFINGLERTMTRDPFLGEHCSLAHNPSRLAGIGLGAKAIGHTQAMSWIKAIIDKLTDAHDPLYLYVQYQLSHARSLVGQRHRTLYEDCFLEWLHRHAMTDTLPDRDALLVRAATDLHYENALQAAMIWTSINHCLYLTLTGSRQHPRHVVTLLDQFEAAMKRWRWDDEDKQHVIQWTILGEREVQDILWLILRSTFPDAIDEEHLEKFGHSAYRADFALPSLGTLIEVKYATAATDFKTLEKEILEDAIPYLQSARFDHLIVFIYDASASVQEHDITRTAVRQIPGVYDCVIVSRPSHVPVVPTAARRPRQKASGR